jgi:expansin
MPLGRAVRVGTIIGMAAVSQASLAAQARVYSVLPCRIVDTRDAASGPALLAGSVRSFVVAGSCGVSPTAGAVAVNLTATAATTGGHLRLFPKGQAVPPSSTINYGAGQTRANNAIVAVGSDGSLSVYVGQTSGSVHVILDVNGYFDDPSNNQPPAVSAGADQTVVLPATATLNGQASDDGKPGATLTYAWTMVSGPAAVTLGSPSSLSSSATFSSAGTYVLRLTASDSLLASHADVTITVRSSLGPPKAGGQFHLGPVDFAETQWHNACAPAGGYRAELRSSTGLGGELLAGVSYAYDGGGAVCDSCIRIDTQTGRSQVARVVTYGASNTDEDLDVSPSVYQALDTGVYPRSMSWQFTPCPGTGPISYEFQTASSIWWTSFWVRNPKVPVTKVEVKSANHAQFFTLRRETDGTLNDDGGFGAGPFTLRITGMDGQVLTETIPSFGPGQLITSSLQFQ